MTSRTGEFIVLLIFVAGKASSNQEIKENDETEEQRPNLDSRFFDIGGIINQLFPGLGQVIQGGPYDAPGGNPYPANNQFYPGTIQRPSNQGPMTNWPIIDDASQYPSKGHTIGNPQQTLMPPQNGFNPELTQYPKQGDLSYPQQGQYPNQGNIANPQQRPNTNLGNGIGGMQYPDQGNANQFPKLPGSQSQPSYPKQQGIANQYPNGGNFGTPTQYEYPSQDGLQQNQFPKEEGPGKGPVNDGTLYSVLPPDQMDNVDPSNPQSGNDGRNPTAILGRPVVVPPINTPEGQIFFPNSTESSSRRQCVQDCQSTSEYNPVCGSNNITYFNPGKFVCARNCGINVFVSRRGRCPDDAYLSRN